MSFLAREPTRNSTIFNNSTNGINHSFRCEEGMTKNSVESLHRPNYAVFDVLVFSCVEAVAKPDRRIYQITLEKLGSEPQQSVFIDDRPDYVQGAKDAGLNAIIFEDFEQVKGELARLGLKVG